MGSFVPQIVFRWWKGDNTPAVGWTVGFYGAGLDPISGNLKTVYSDLAQTTPIANPVTLDAEGKATVVLGPGGYKLVIRDDGGTTKFTMDNIDGGGGFGAGFGCQFVDTIAAMKALEAGSSAFCYVAGYFAAKDGGGGMFRWNGSASASDNAGYIIIPDSAPTLGRWERIPDEADTIRAKSFGVIPDGTTDGSARLAIADAYAVSNDKELLIEGANGAPSLKLSGTIFLSAKVVRMGVGVAFSGTSALTFNGYFIGGHENRFASGMTVFFSANQINDAPEQFGATLDAADNHAAFERWKSAGGGAMSLPPGLWYNLAGWTEPTIPIRYLGEISATLDANSRKTGFNFPENVSRGRIGYIETTYGIKFTGGLSSPYQIYPRGGGDGLETDAALFNFLHDTNVAGTAVANVVRSTTDITAGGNVIAGYTGIGTPVGRVGSSELQFSSGGNFYFSPSNPGSLVLPSNLLKNAGDRLVISANILSPHSGYTSPGTIALTFDSAAVASFATSDPGSGTAWGFKLISTITYITSTSAIFETALQLGYDASATITDPSATQQTRHSVLNGATVDFTVTQVVSLTIASGMSVQGFWIDYLPVAT